MIDWVAGTIFIIIPVLFLGYLFPDRIGLVIGSLIAGLSWTLLDRMLRCK